MVRSALVLGLAIVIAVPAIGQAPKEKASIFFEMGRHSGHINAALFTKDSKQLITVADDKTIRFWDVERGEQVKVLYPPIGPGTEGSLLAAALSPDGKTLAVGGHGYGDEGNRQSPIFLIDLQTDRVHRVLKGHANATVRALAFSPDGKRLASGEADRPRDPKRGAIREWNLDTNETELILGPKNGLADQLLYLPDGKSLVWRDYTRAGFVDIANNKTTFLQVKKGESVGRLALSPNGKFLVSFNAAGIRFSDLQGRQMDFILHKEGMDGGLDCAFTPDSNKLLVTSRNARAILLNLETKKHEVAFDVPKTNTAAYLAAVAPNGEVAATISDRSSHVSIYLWKVADGSLLHRISDTSWPGVLVKLGCSADGQAVSWLGTHAFHLADLQFGPAVPDKELRAQVRTQGELSLGGGGWNAVMKDNAKFSVLKMPAHLGGLGGNAHTFYGKDMVAAGTLRGEIGLFRSATGEFIRHTKGAHATRIREVFPCAQGKYLLSYSYDRTFCVWNPERKQPLMHLFVSEPEVMSGRGGTREWVVWTPEGYYAASPGGEKMIGWHVGNGPDQLATFYPIDRFRKTFYRPDVIGRLLEFGSLDKALEAADKERGAKSTRVPLEDALPATVSILSPTTGTTLTEGKVTVKAKAVSQGKSPVTEMQLMLDGRPVVGALHLIADPKLGAVEATWTIAVPEGRHLLSVVARSALSSGLSPETEIAYNDAKAGAARPTLYVLSIGINDYVKDRRLNVAVKDAEGIEKVFKSESKATYRDVKTKLLTNQAATKQGILDGLTWLHKNMQAQDVAVIFYAGHGLNKKGNFFLCPIDTNFANPEGTAITDDEIKKRLTDMPGRILVMLDACHSGAAGVRIDRLARDLSDEDCGVVVMCAATGREEAGEDKQSGGYFAQAVIQGLSGQGDRSKKDGQVYLHHLDSYVYEKVVQLSNDAQHPVVGRPTSVRTFALAKPGG